jgi:hypothetical protein
MLRLALVPARSVSFCLENVTIRHSNSPAKTPTRHATHAEKALFLVVVVKDVALSRRRRRRKYERPVLSVRG